MAEARVTELSGGRGTLDQELSLSIDIDRARVEARHVLFLRFHFMYILFVYLSAFQCMYIACIFLLSLFPLDDHYSLYVLVRSASAAPDK